MAIEINRLMESGIIDRIGFCSGPEELDIVTPLMGVAGLILNTNCGKILTVRERNSKWKTQKFQGMRSIPMETMETGETKSDTLRRLVEEEVSRVRVDRYWGDSSIINWCIGGFYVHPEVFVHLYLLHGEDDLTKVNTGDDVGESQWIDPMDIINSRKYIINKENVDALPDFLDPDIKNALIQTVSSMGVEDVLNIGSLRWRPGTEEAILAYKTYISRGDLSPAVVSVFCRTIDKLPKDVFKYVPGSDLFGQS